MPQGCFPVLLITLRSFFVLRGGTHSILPKRRNPEYSEFRRLFLSLPIAMTPFLKDHGLPHSYDPLLFQTAHLWNSLTEFYISRRQTRKDMFIRFAQFFLLFFQVVQTIITGTSYIFKDGTSFPGLHSVNLLHFYGPPCHYH